MGLLWHGRRTHGRRLRRSGTEDQSPNSSDKSPANLFSQLVEMVGGYAEPTVTLGVDTLNGSGVDIWPLLPPAGSGTDGVSVSFFYGTYRASCRKRLGPSPANEPRKRKCGEGGSYYSNQRKWSVPAANGFRKPRSPVQASPPSVNLEQHSQPGSQANNASERRTSRVLTKQSEPT